MRSILLSEHVFKNAKRRGTSMFGLIVLAVWIGFVASYLIWQQLSGDLVSGWPETAAERPPRAVTEERGWSLPAVTRPGSWHLTPPAEGV